MISFKDGRINAVSLLQTLDKYLKHKKINYLQGEIIKIRKQTINGFLQQGIMKISNLTWCLCNSLKAIDLIDSRYHNIKLNPSFSQTREIEINDAEVDLLSLPKQFNINGKNIIPKSKNTLIIDQLTNIVLSQKKIHSKTHKFSR